MLYLFLAVITSAMISVFMRLSASNVKNNMVMFFSNYLVCTVLSLAFQFRGGLPDNVTGLSFTVFMGTISGFMFLASFILLQKNIRENGVVLSAVFMKLGVLIPTLTAILIYHEQPGAAAVAGFAAALAAIILINTEGTGSRESAGAKWLLIILLLSGGFTDTLSNIFNKGSTPEFRDLYLIGTFAVAGVFAAALAVHRKQHITVQDILWGALIGIPNYFTTRFLLLSLAEVPAIIVYPAYNIGTILVVSITGILAFHEKLTRRKLIGMALIMAALTLLNI